MRRNLSKFKNKSSVQLSKSSTTSPMPDPVLSPTIANAGPARTVVVPECPLPVPVPVSENSQAESVGNRPQLNALLENLPPEVRRQLLSTLEVEELSALVHASPVFYQQYLLDRRYLLCTCLETTLRSTTVDACTVYRTSLAEFSDMCTREKATQFLQSYQDQRSSTQYLSCTESLTEDEAVRIVAFHSSVIKPLAQHYTSWTLANLADETKDLQSREPLSRTEETRLLRALYRFQLCCNLFGRGSHRTFQQPRFGFSSVDIQKIFICIFEPWEVEEIACICTFSKEKYDQIFREIRWDVHKDNPKFERQRPPTPDGTFDLDGGSRIRDDLLKGTISRGLELLHTVFFAIRDHAHLVSIMQEHISRSIGNFLESEALSEAAQDLRRLEQLSDRDQKQLRRDPLPFEGDGEPDVDRMGPPLAWTVIWNGTYSNLYGDYVDDDIRRWGYIMWDAARLKRTDAKEVLLRQWEADWWFSDPRDDLLY